MKAKEITAGMQVVIPKFGKKKDVLFAISRLEGKNARLVNMVNFTECTFSEFLLFAKDGRVYPEGVDAKALFDNNELSTLI